MKTIVTFKWRTCIQFTFHLCKHLIFICFANLHDIHLKDWNIGPPFEEDL
jgi:hypothetical protein